MDIINVNNLSKNFVNKKGPVFRKKKQILKAVDNVSFSIRQGEIFSLLGPNGAGKTTTIKMLATLLIPTSGTASIKGYDIVKNDHDVRRVMTAVLPGEADVAVLLPFTEVTVLLVALALAEVVAFALPEENPLRAP